MVVHALQRNRTVHLENFSTNVVDAGTKGADLVANVLHHLADWDYARARLMF